MTYEVEQKFYVTDLGVTERALDELDAPVGKATAQTDTYLRHPCRDFGRTDEAVRLRRVGDANFITYKGPRVDATTKTRLELQLALPDGPEFASGFLELVSRLGFGVLVEVRKLRRAAVVDWEGGRVEVALDDVEQLGAFVELETAADASDLDAARRRVASLAERLALTRNERTSYCELMLERRAAQGLDRVSPDA